MTDLTPDIERVLSEQTERLCEVMHDAYEAAAVEVGWETQQRSRVPWADVPEANKATVRAAVAALSTHLAEQIAALVEQREEAAISAFLDTLPPHLFSEHTAGQIREWADEWRQG